MMDCHCSKGRKCTFATVPQQALMLGSQLSFATVQGTVVLTVAEDMATVYNGRKALFFLFEKDVATI